MTINPNHALSFPNKFQHHTRTNLSKKKNHGGNVVLSYKKKINKKTKQSFIIYFSQSTINNNYHNKYKRTRKKKKKKNKFIIPNKSCSSGFIFRLFFFLDKSQSVSTQWLESVGDIYFFVSNVHIRILLTS
jgi:hypothetical protein